jgi:hypothetical protein
MRPSDRGHERTDTLRTLGNTLLDTYADDSHLSRRLLKCRECAQLYFFEFYEEIDWLDSKDPQYVTYIPVETRD